MLFVAITVVVVVGSHPKKKCRCAMSIGQYKNGITTAVVGYTIYREIEREKKNRKKTEKKNL